MTSSSRIPRSRTHRTAFALLVAVLAALVAVPGAQAAAPAPPTPTPTAPAGQCPYANCTATTTPDGFRYVYLNGKLQRVPAAVNVGGKAMQFVPACVGLDCFGPANTCQLNELLAGYLVDPTGKTNNVAACTAAAAPALNVGAVQAELTTYLREKALPRPVLKIQPNGRSFTNLPTIFWLPNPATFVLPVDQPVAATITAVPHYLWNFGDGTTGPDSPGRPFDPTISPTTDPAYYVSHAYLRPGTFPVTLTVTWQGTFTLAGAAQAIPLGAVTLAANAPVTVNEAAGVLTGNG